MQSSTKTKYQYQIGHSPKKKEVTIISYDSFLKVDNNKLKSIFINFSTALSCPSNKKALCPSASKCYALSDEKRFKNVYYKNLLNSVFINEIMNNVKEFNKFVKYCILNPNYIIRYNKDGDFRGFKDVLFIERVYMATNNSLGGYTKRTDLIDKNKKGITFPLNLSQIDYITTTDLKKYLNHKNTCKGYCNTCLKCYKHHTNPILTLLHGARSKIDTEFNTFSNRAFSLKRIFAK